MTLVRSKLLWFTLAVAVILSMTGVIDLPSPGGRPEHGPRQIGFNKQFKCRYMTVEVESTFTKAQRRSGVKTIAARMSADLGSAGHVEGPILLVHSPGGYYKREFCAKPGSSLHAQVVAVEMVDTLECYFMSGPSDDTDNETSAYDTQVSKDYKAGNANHISTWCVGVVP